ncbi:zinc-binding alcohol dehydrogenase family protein [Porticoccaceae bacterium LTM1]|nr:zinc-binding alcohol dehydrogenase family protein [Porticoccaceae bacterium LTM1]
MKVIGYSGKLQLQHPNAFVTFEMEYPEPANHDLLVEVSAVSVNPIDTKIRARTDTPQHPPKILGWDAVGTVIATGPKVTRFKPGDRVYYAGDITRPGCNASHQLVDERITGHCPTSLSNSEAAALPLTTITAWEALFDRLKINRDNDRNKTLLIIGAAGGVGSMAIQLAREIGGLNVIATASRPQSRQWCFNMGANSVVDHRSDLVSEFRQKRLPAPDYILCCNSPDQHFSAMAELIAPQGMICSIVDFNQTPDMNVLKPKSVGFVWEFMFTRPMQQTKDISAQGELLDRVAALVDRGTLKTTLRQNLGAMSPASLCEAHRLIEQGSTIGKIVLEGIQ